jgi:hypothetical protein
VRHAGSTNINITSISHRVLANTAAPSPWAPYLQNGEAFDNDDNDGDDDNSVQFFIIYVPSQQLQGQLQTAQCR